MNGCSDPKLKATLSKESAFRFLDGLRESGKVNMFGAAPVLAEVFGLSMADAKGLWVEWTKTFPRGE